MLPFHRDILMIYMAPGLNDETAEKKHIHRARTWFVIGEKSGPGMWCLLIDGEESPGTSVRKPFWLQSSRFW